MICYAYMHTQKQGPFTWMPSGAETHTVLTHAYSPYRQKLFQEKHTWKIICSITLQRTDVNEMGR